MRKIRFTVEFDLDDNHDWAVSGQTADPARKLAPLPDGMPALLPFIFATILRDYVAPKTGEVHLGHIKIEKFART